MHRIFQRIKRGTWAIIVPIQKVLVTILLLLTYVVGLCATRLVVMVFRRDLLGRGDVAAKTLWKDATGYDPDRNESVRQS